jgi:hypothetical protein
MTSIEYEPGFARIPGFIIILLRVSSHVTKSGGSVLPASTTEVTTLAFPRYKNSGLSINGKVKLELCPFFTFSTDGTPFANYGGFDIISAIIGADSEDVVLFTLYKRRVKVGLFFYPVVKVANTEI